MEEKDPRDSIAYEPHIKVKRKVSINAPISEYEQAEETIPEEATNLEEKGEVPETEDQEVSAEPEQAEAVEKEDHVFQTEAGAQRSPTQSLLSQATFTTVSKRSVVSQGTAEIGVSPDRVSKRSVVSQGTTEIGVSPDKIPKLSFLSQRSADIEMSPEKVSKRSVVSQGTTEIGVSPDKIPKLSFLSQRSADIEVSPDKGSKRSVVSQGTTERGVPKLSILSQRTADIEMSPDNVPKLSFLSQRTVDILSPDKVSKRSIPSQDSAADTFPKRSLLSQGTVASVDVVPEPEKQPDDSRKSQQTEVQSHSDRHVSLSVKSGSTKEEVFTLLPIEEGSPEPTVYSLEKSEQGSEQNSTTTSKGTNELSLKSVSLTSMQKFASGRYSTAKSHTPSISTVGTKSFSPPLSIGASSGKSGSVSLLSQGTDISINLSEDIAVAKRRHSSLSWFSFASDLEHSDKDKKSLGMASTTEDTEGSVSIASGQPEIDRNMYYNLHGVLTGRHMVEKQKNNILQLKLARYFSRRKMYYIFREPAVFFEETRDRYNKELDRFEVVSENSYREKTMLEEEVQHMKVKCNQQKARLEALMDKMIQEEMDYVSGLNLEQMGKANFDKVVERWTRSQRSQMDVLIQVRLLFIKLRNGVQAKMKALDELDNLGAGYHIMDFVELKQDNKVLQDRLEEKEAEILKFRDGTKNTMQILAHNREKLEQTDVDIAKYREIFETLNQEYFDAREQLSYLKRERYVHRNNTKRLKCHHGLLAYPKLRHDMGKASAEIDGLRNRIDRLQKECEERSQKIRAVRKNMEICVMRKKKEEQRKLELRFQPSSMDTLEASGNKPLIDYSGTSVINVIKPAESKGVSSMILVTPTLSTIRYKNVHSNI